MLIVDTHVRNADVRARQAIYVTPIDDDSDEEDEEPDDLAASLTADIPEDWAPDAAAEPRVFRAGRLSLNPVKHVDPFGTVLLPGLLLLFKAPVLFGYAKPVPVDFARLRNPRRDMMLVAVAGPAANIVLLVISAILGLTDAALYYYVRNKEELVYLCYLRAGERDEAVKSYEQICARYPAAADGVRDLVVSLGGFCR